jgi:hypothetical protein
MQEFLQGICSLLLNKFGMNAQTNLGRRQSTKKNEVGKCIPPLPGVFLLDLAELSRLKVVKLTSRPFWRR